MLDGLQIEKPASTITAIAREALPAERPHWHELARIISVPLVMGR